MDKVARTKCPGRLLECMSEARLQRSLVLINMAKLLILECETLVDRTIEQLA